METEEEGLAGNKTLTHLKKETPRAPKEKHPKLGQINALFEEKKRLEAEEKVVEKIREADKEYVEGEREKDKKSKNRRLGDEQKDMRKEEVSVSEKKEEMKKKQIADQVERKIAKDDELKAEGRGEG